MIFFRPTRSFCQWLIDYANGRLIMDVGCGECYFLKKLNHLGAKCLGIDPWVEYRTIHEMLLMGVQVVPFEAEEFSLITDHKDSLLVFSRPGHCGFVERVLRANGGNEVLYIAKPENLRKDIPRDFRVYPLDTPRCRVERTYAVYPKVSTMQIA